MHALFAGAPPSTRTPSADAMTATLRCGRHALDLSRPRVMGVLNVTPDSFSDGGRFLDPARALEHARAMLADGADLVDVGGESTRPGAAAGRRGHRARARPAGRRGARARRRDRVGRHDQARGDARGDRRRRLDDQRRARARRAGGAGRGRGERRRGVPHAHARRRRRRCRRRRATPTSPPRWPRSCASAPGPASRPASRATASRSIRASASARRWRIISTWPRGSREVVALGWPVLVGVSRKSMLGALTGRASGDRVAAGLAAALALVARGATIVRTHDVRETVDALATWRAMDAGVDPRTEERSGR